MLTIEQIKTAVAKVGKKYGIKRAYLFGSYARGEANETSDVDLVIDKGRIKGIQLSGFRLDLIDELGGIDVDVLTNNGMRQDFSQFIQSDKVLIYGA